MFLFSETIAAVFYRILADFDKVKNGTSSLFGDNIGSFWSSIVLLVFLYFVMVTIKYFALGTSILIAGKNIHEKMVEAIVRSPGSFFDSTPSGTIINKFSNDLGVIDHSLFFSFMYSLEGLAIFFVSAINLCQINPIMIFPILVIMTAAILLFAYARPAIIKCKDLDLQNKSPIFHKSGELINGLIQIRIHEQRLSQIRSFG